MTAPLALSLLLAIPLTLTTADGVRIESTYRAPDRVTRSTPAAILVPMYLRPRTTWAAFAEAAARGGIATLAIDPRGHGQSANPTGRPVQQWGGREWMGVLRDIRAARERLVAKGFAPARIVVIGASIGASLSLEYAVADRQIAGVGLLSLSTNLTGRSEAHDIGRLPKRPVFIAYADNDGAFVQISARLAQAAGARATVRRYARAGHGTGMFGREDTPGDLTRSLIGWVERTTATAPVGKDAPGPKAGVGKRLSLAARPGVVTSVRLAERAAASSVAEMQRRFGWTPAQLARAGHEDYRVAEESMRVYLPRGHRADRPHGVIVWIGPGDDGAFPAAWQRALDRHGLIAAGLVRAGNGRLVPIRIGLAIDALHHLRRRVALDAGRIYIAGFSGGARTASMAALGFPDLFTGGGLFCGGVSFYRSASLADGRTLPADFRAPTPARQAVARSRRLILWSGAEDPGAAATRLRHQAMGSAGYTRVALRLVPGVGHQPPSGAQFAEALRLLDPRD